MTNQRKPTHGGRRPGAGRKLGSKTVKDTTRRVTYGTRLPAWLVDWLKAQDRPGSRLIEDALVNHFHLIPPTDPHR